MKTLKVDLAPAKGSKKSKGKAKAMDFTAWVEHYVAMSKGNPV